MTADGFDWRSLAPLPPYRPPGEPRPFELEQCLREFVGRRGKGAAPSAVPFPAGPVTPREAQFWLEAGFLQLGRDRATPARPEAMADLLRAIPFTGEVDLEEFFRRAAAPWHYPYSQGFYSPLIVPPLLYLFTAEQMVELYARTGWLAEALAADFSDRVLPSLDEAARENYRRLLRPHLNPSHWPATFRDSVPTPFFVASDLGMEAEFRPVILGWPEGPGYRPGEQHYLRFICRFDDADFVHQQGQRLRARLHTAVGLCLWLAATGKSGLGRARDEILRATSHGDAAVLLRGLAKVEAAEAAPYMLQLMVESRAPQLAKKWLDEHPALAVRGLVPAAAGTGRLADAAVHKLRELKHAGHGAAIREALAHAPPAAAERVRREVLEDDGARHPPLDPDSTPPALTVALAVAPGPKGASSGLLSLPPVLVGGRRLSVDQVAAVLAALRASALDSPHPLVAALRAHADRDALDAFAWRLFEDWILGGAPARQTWPLFAVGFLGSGASADRLLPLVRKWPGDSRRLRAGLALRCLCAIGEPAALRAVGAVAVTAAGRALRTLAAGIFAEAAGARGLTPNQLEDRLVPDCGLGEREPFVFDFGPRRFRLALAPGPRPAVRDEAGKLRAALPAPNSKDDAAKAAAATAEWKRLRRQIAETFQAQARRLRREMNDARRWEPAEFESAIARHPLMSHLARQLVWAAFDAAGRLTATFRVTEDGDWADASDASVSRAGVARVGLAHPLELTPAVRQAWVGLLYDYEIIPPFDQFGGAVYPLDEAERAGTELKRAQTLGFPRGALSRWLDDQAWLRAPSGGDCAEHRRPIHACGLTVVVTYDPAINAAERHNAPPQRVTACFFLRIGSKGGPRRPLGEVPAVVVSELVRDLTGLAARAAEKK